MICKQKKKRRIYDSDTGEKDFNFDEHVKHNIRTKENINVKIQSFTRDFIFKNNKMNFMELKKMQCLKLILYMFIYWIQQN